jgi:hypothetical protein
VARLNAAAACAPTWPELIDGRRIERTAATEVNATLAALAASAIEVFGGQQRDQVRACGRWPLCVRFFLRNHPRRGYCSPQCLTVPVRCVTMTGTGMTADSNQGIRRPTQLTADVAGAARSVVD